MAVLIGRGLAPTRRAAPRRAVTGQRCQGREATDGPRMALCAPALLLALLEYRGRDQFPKSRRLRFDTNWANGVNWSAGRPPAPGEVAVVDGPGDALLDLPARVRVRSLVLARAGALLLRRDGSLALVDPGPGRGAPDTNGAQNWLDPEAWEPADRTLAPVWAAVPHALRVPCRWDFVLLPFKTTFALRLPPLPLTVALVILNPPWVDPSLPEAYTSQDSFRLRQFIYGLSWQRLVDDGRFVLPPAGAGEEVGAVRTRWGQCTEQAGCACAAPATLAAAVEQRVCALQRPRCARAPPPPCEAPVQPRGHCCPVCGCLRINVTYFKDIVRKRK
ncbi:Uncharacterized protein GBIM_10146 [Gryllus bimaculatus]|nr:Uncharacterized protein GBIM_10146 [Gryllus bimaculatus]